MTSDLLTQLRAYGEQLDVEAAPLEHAPPLPASPPQTRWRPLVVAVAAAAVTLLLIGGAAWLLRGDQGEPADPVPEVPETWQTWTSTDGIVSDCACEMVMAADGSIWIVGFDGVSRFDGIRWDRIELPQPFTGEGWPAIAPAGDGSVWVSGMSYIAQYEDGAWATVVAAEDANRGGELGPVWFEDVEVDDDGLVWTSYEDVEGVILDGAFTPRERADEEADPYPDAPLQVVLATAPDGAIWMAMGDALSGVEGALVASSGERMTRHALGGVETAVFEEDGTGWFLVPEVGRDAWIYGRAQWSDPGLYRLEGDTWYRITTEHGLAGYRFSEMIVTPDGAMWLSTSDGTVTRYQPGTDPQAGTQVEIESRPFTDAEIPPPDE